MRADAHSGGRGAGAEGDCAAGHHRHICWHACRDDRRDGPIHSMTAETLAGRADRAQFCAARARRSPAARPTAGLRNRPHLEDDYRPLLPHLPHPTSANTTATSASHACPNSKMAGPGDAPPRSGTRGVHIVSTRAKSPPAHLQPALGALLRNQRPPLLAGTKQRVDVAAAHLARRHHAPQLRCACRRVACEGRSERGCGTGVARSREGGRPAR